jgi:biotin carboxylase
MDQSRKSTILCISTYEKGQVFLQEAARLGCSVILLTVNELEHGNWPRSSIAKFITMPKGLTPEQVLNTVTYLARFDHFDRVVALDEFDLEVAALIREHMRLPGMGQSATRYFRDKLAMRVCAQQSGVPVPEFTSVFDYESLRKFIHSVSGPWLLKPRTNASAIGIKTIHDEAELFGTLDQLGDLQSHYVLERFVPGEIFHVEGITWAGSLVFSAPYKYGAPPMETMHQGGIFSTRALAAESDDAHRLNEMNRQVLESLGMQCGVTHTEFIKSYADGNFYFLETAARVGGAHIADVVELASGINPWAEWARLEMATLGDEPYELPDVRGDYAASVICLARQQEPDTSSYDAPEVVRHLDVHHHAGLILRSPDSNRLEELVREYTTRFLAEFCAVEPVPDTPTA